MLTQLDSETCRVLQRYVDGQLSNAELEEWLVQIEYDSDIAAEERDALAQVRLIAIEVGEGRRPPDSILESVAKVLAAPRPSEPVLAFRTGSNTSWEQRLTFTAAPSRLERVGISA